VIVRWRAIVLTCAFGWLAFGCDRSDRPTSTADEPITIVYWTRAWWGDPGQFQGPNPIPVPQWQQEQIDRFEHDHPGVKVDMQVDPGGKGDKIRMAFAGGVPPDLFHGNPEQEFLTWAALGFLEPIDPYLTPEDRADIFPTALKAGEYNGKHYAWPLYNHALCMAINRDLFRERGLEDQIPGPEEDWSFERFAELAKALTFDRDGDGRIDVYGVGLHTLDDNHVFITSYLTNAGARVFGKDGRFILDSDQGVKSLTFIHDLMTKGYLTPGAASYNYEDVRSLFLKQRIAMYLTGAGIVDWAEDQAKKGTIKRFDWALVPIPHVAPATPTSYLAVGAVYVAKQTDPRKRDACMALAKYITGPELNKQFWNRASPRRSSPPPPDPNMVVMMQQVERAENFMIPPVKLPDRFNINDELTHLYQDVFARPPKGAPEEILRDAASRINAKLGF
jgi:multiple sugar transport system substrate-binding protein